MHDALVITGTSGSGKTTVARRLTEVDEDFAIVEAVTTRDARTDDQEGQYEYVDADQFETLAGAGELLVRTKYRKQSYGIRRAAFRRVQNAGRTPVLVITPESAQKASIVDPVADSEWRPLVVFIDAGGRRFG